MIITVHLYYEVIYIEYGGQGFSDVITSLGIFETQYEAKKFASDWEKEHPYTIKCFGDVKIIEHVDR